MIVMPSLHVDGDAAAVNVVRLADVVVEQRRNVQGLASSHRYMQRQRLGKLGVPAQIRMVRVDLVTQTEGGRMRE